MLFMYEIRHHMNDMFHSVYDYTSMVVSCVVSGDFSMSH